MQKMSFKGSKKVNEFHFSWVDVKFSVRYFLVIVCLSNTLTQCHVEKISFILFKFKCLQLFGEKYLNRISTLFCNCFPCFVNCLLFSRGFFAL